MAVPAELWAVWERISRRRPLVHCLTNPVTVNDCANVLLAAGARPFMAAHPDEVEEVQRHADALVVNMGAIAQLDSIGKAARQAAERGHPIIVDPVGVAASSLRRRSCIALLKEFPVACVRGNGAEIRALLGDTGTARGVDASSEDAASAHETAVQLARRYGCVAVASGAVDAVTDGRRTFSVGNGDAMMARVTGMGCMLSSLLGAAFAVENSLRAAAAVCAVVGLSGEQAAAGTCAARRGPAYFRDLFVDTLFSLDEAQFMGGAKYSEG
ncbi:hydroxyethylthiazole kinase [Pyramidobacter sp.]|uniref:hydroxyethylthiazole kinase n=1 Tax=Pyramidobacter sp. TaxID=1943581 RepID=UPI00332B6072